MKKHILALAFITLCLAPAPLFAAEQAAHLSNQDKSDIARIENYLNNLKNISADFMQIDDAGGIMHGTLDISRPGKMHVAYNPPNKDFIIADGSFVHIWDDSLQNQTNVPQGSSLAEFILRDPVKLAGDVTITKIQHFAAKIEVTLVQTTDPGAGSLTLVFEDRPLNLRQWKVLDAEGHSTGVNLQNMEEVASFPRDTFVFVPPNFGKN